MKLKEYFETTGIKKSHLAKAVKVAPSFITFLLQGKARPSPERAKAIEKATKGMVTRMELLYPND